jgi:hypothetical protein
VTRPVVPALVVSRCAARGLAVLAAAGLLSVLGAASASAAGVSGDPVTVNLGTILGPGSLVISVSNSQVTLSTPVLNTSGTLFVATGQLQPITVTDNRTGDPGWTLTGVLSGGPQYVAPNLSPNALGYGGQDLGWNPTLADESAGQLINLGLNVKPAPGSGAGTPGGLAQQQILAFTASGFGLGTAHLGAKLTLDLPAGTPAGTYIETLTLTAI